MLSNIFNKIINLSIILVEQEKLNNNVKSIVLNVIQSIMNDFNSSKFEIFYLYSVGETKEIKFAIN